MKKKILVIEDSEIIASLLQDNLELIGHEVIIANSGIEGLRKAEIMQPDLITLDIMMPELDGIQVLKELKTNEATKNIPVIIISVAESSRREGLKLGAVAFFKKPVDFRQLNYRIQSITEKKTILVVEDNPELLLLLKVRLNAMGYNVHCASDGVDIVKKVKEVGPDIILMDIVLPSEDGFVIIKKLKEDEETAKIPVIAFSGYFSDDVVNGQVIGVDKFIGKSFSAEDLAKEVDQFLTDDGKKEED